MVLPLVLHTEAVSDDTVTASPELELATTWNGETPNVLLACGANVMNCGVEPARAGMLIVAASNATKQVKRRAAHAAARAFVGSERMVAITIGIEIREIRRKGRIRV